MIEPEELDETISMDLQVLKASAVLRGRPTNGEACGGCRYYLEADDDPSYCWHPRLRILVSHDWWCQWWENETAALAAPREPQTEA